MILPCVFYQLGADYGTGHPASDRLEAALVAAANDGLIVQVNGGYTSAHTQPLRRSCRNKSLALNELDRQPASVLLGAFNAEPICRSRPSITALPIELIIGILKAIPAAVSIFDARQAYTLSARAFAGSIYTYIAPPSFPHETH